MTTEMGMMGMMGMSGAMGMMGMSGAMGMMGMSGHPALYGELAPALMLSRDGLVGVVDRPVAALALEGASDAAMAAWSADVRAMIIEADLMQRVACFGFSAAADGTAETSAALHAITAAAPGHRGRSVEYQSAPLVEFIRPTPDDFVAQADIVLNYADLRADRIAEIVAQVDLPLVFFAGAAPLDEERTKYTLQLVALVRSLAARIGLQIKHAIAAVRPNHYSAQIHPVIPTPGHGALPSGHATQAFAIALVLAEVMGARDKLRAMLLQQAARIAVNRTVAGVHFPADSIAGLVLGRALAGLVAGHATDDEARLTPMTFDGRGIGALDFRWSDYVQADGSSAGGAGNGVVHATEGLDPVVLDGPASATLAWLWQRARREWADA